MVSESETEPLGFLFYQLERHTVQKVVEESSVDLPPLFPGNYLLHLLVGVDYLMDNLSTLGSVEGTLHDPNRDNSNMAHTVDMWVNYQQDYELEG